jgi:hypothetical protein
MAKPLLPIGTPIRVTSWIMAGIYSQPEQAIGTIVGILRTVPPEDTGFDAPVHWYEVHFPGSFWPSCPLSDQHLEPVD